MADLRHRIKWLRRREKHLRTRAFGPRYKEPQFQYQRFVGHVGPYDAYIIDRGNQKREVWLMCPGKTHMATEGCAKQFPSVFPLHLAALELEKLQCQESTLDARN